MPIDILENDIQSRKYKQPRKGWTIGVMPLPDGRRVRYEAQGKHALKIILALWQAECRLVEFTLAH